jgi:hypothetical protein
MDKKLSKQNTMNYKLPSTDLLEPLDKILSYQNQTDEIKQQCQIIERTLADFRVNGKVIGVTRGPSVTRFELEPAPGVKVSSFVNLADDIALRLAVSSVRMEAPIPGKAAIGIEVPNINNDMVRFRELVDCEAVRKNPSKLCVGLGKDVEGKVITIDLARMPHLLVAGTPGSGKTVCVNTLLAGIMYKARPDEVQFILVDSHVAELTNFNGIPHLMVPVVTDAKEGLSALYWAVWEMERRYKTFADTRVRDIKAYNAQAEEKMPYIVIVIDEMSDLMMVAKADVEDAILRLAQKARACGIHMVLATQRPSVDVITGIVKANIPSRIAFAVSSLTDSRTILDMGGAEKLLGKGDMLFYPVGANKPSRVQGAFISDEELNKITYFIKKQGSSVEYNDEITSLALPCDRKTEEMRVLAEQKHSHLSFDRYELDQNSRRILRTIIMTFAGGPVGVDTIAASSHEKVGTIINVVEPQLIQMGLLKRTPRGRVVTKEAYRVFGIPYPEDTMNNTITKKIRESLVTAGVIKRLANSVKFPEAIAIEETGNKVVIKLTDKAIGMGENVRSYSNMQNDDAAFEGWALLLYAHYAKEKNYKIELDLTEAAYESIMKAYQEKAPYEYVNNRRHYNRFLYRALRFSQQYKEWFALTNRLTPYVNAFGNYLSNSYIGFTNNIPNEEKPGKNHFATDKINENAVEDIFADLNWQQNQGAEFCKKYGGNLYRQLPAGLFQGDTATEKGAIFTGKKSAIDLWSCNGTELNVFELQYNNKMTGILTELFFYSNYMRDMFCRGEAINFNCQKLIPNTNGFRGYKHLEKASFTKVNGYMLYEQGHLHQAITDKVLVVMNEADFSDDFDYVITYGIIKYKIADKTILV